MSESPKKTKQVKGLSSLMENKKFVFILSLLISFFVWVAVAMYASPEESYTIYNVPINVDTQNSIVSQKGYVNFWQSDEKIDVTVTGPRYLITSLTPDDILVSANLNTVDSAGVSELALKVSLKESSQDITISAQSKTSVEIYFDTQLEKEFAISLDSAHFDSKVAEGYLLKSSELTVSTVKYKGPATEIAKIVNVIATPELTEDLLFETTTLPVALSLEGTSAADTVSVNKYVEMVDAQEYFVKVNIDRIAELAPEVAFTGEKTGETAVSFNVETVIANIDTEVEYESLTLPIITVDYSQLEEGRNTFYAKAAEIELPEGVSLTDTTFTFSIVIDFTPTQSE